MHQNAYARNITYITDIPSIDNAMQCRLYLENQGSKSQNWGLGFQANSPFSLYCLQCTNMYCYPNTLTNYNMDVALVKTEWISGEHFPTVHDFPTFLPWTPNAAVFVLFVYMNRCCRGKTSNRLLYHLWLVVYFWLIFKQSRVTRDNTLGFVMHVLHVQLWPTGSIWSYVAKFEMVFFFTLDKSRDSELQNGMSYSAFEEQWESNYALNYG